MIIRKPFYYIRHGQTDWNVEGRFQGRKDIPLNDTGIEQAHSAKKFLERLPITNIYASTLKRARATADIVNEGLNLSITGMDGLQECNFGVLEGQLRNSTVNRDNFSEDWINGTTPENAETYTDFTIRVIATINSILENDGTPLIVAHGAVFWPITTHMQLTSAETLKNARPVHLTPPINGQEHWKLTEI